MNLIKSLLSQAENGKVLVDIEGNVLSSEKLKSRQRKPTQILSNLETSTLRKQVSTTM